MQTVIVSRLSGHAPRTLLRRDRWLCAADAGGVVNDAEVFVLADLLQVCGQQSGEVGAAGDGIVGAGFGFGSYGDGHLLSHVFEDVSALHVLDGAVDNLLPRGGVHGSGRRLLSGRGGYGGHEDGREEEAGAGSERVWHCGSYFMVVASHASIEGQIDTVGSS